MKLTKFLAADYSQLVGKSLVGEAWMVNWMILFWQLLYFVNDLTDAISVSVVAATIIGWMDMANFRTSSLAFTIML